jgi:hypothetical protein
MPFQCRSEKLADALEKDGWTVLWDPKIRTGEHFDKVVEKALNEAKCVIVMWSKRSVQSRYVRDEATYAMDRHKLVPVAIEPALQAQGSSHAGFAWLGCIERLLGIS